MPMAKAGLLCFSLSRSRAPEQAKKQTGGPKASANARLRALYAQEGNSEQREKNGGMRAWNGDFGMGPVKRPRRETTPTLPLRAENFPTEKGWEFGKWWWNRTPDPNSLSQRVGTA